jgi:hypothetical protein
MSETPACRNCIYWKKDNGTFTVTGWTGMNREDGHCQYEPKAIPKSGESFCHHHTREHGKTQQEGS